MSELKTESHNNQLSLRRMLSRRNAIRDRRFHPTKCALNKSTLPRHEEAAPPRRDWVEVGSGRGYTIYEFK